MNLINKQKRRLISTLCSTFLISVYATATAGSEGTQWRQSQLDNEYKGATAFIGNGNTSIGYLQTKPITTYLYADNRVKRAYSTTLGFSQDLGNQALHFSGSSSPESHSLNFGTTIANTTLSVSSGSGAENAWLANENFTTTNFQQGFSPAKYRYQGANLHYQVNESLGVNASSINIDLDGRVNPSVTTVGMSWQGLSANLLNTRRNNTSIGKGLSLAYQHNKFNSSFEQFSDSSNFTIRTAQLSYNRGKKGIIGLELASGHSPFNGIADNSMMLNYKKRWGHPSYSQYTGGTADSSTVKGHGTFNKAVLLGLGAAAGLAAAIGSSSSNGDGGSGGFATQNNAAQNVLNTINPTSVQENVEYGGWITLSTDTTYAATSPIKGEVASVSIGFKPSNGTASYHTHAGSDPRFDNENFSPQDLLSDRTESVDGYLGTPIGQFKYHNVLTREVSTLGTIAN